jgi:hypothetical protein
VVFHSSPNNLNSPPSKPTPTLLTTLPTQTQNKTTT